MSIKLMLVDDHIAVRSGVRRLLEINKRLEIISDVGSGELAYQCYGELKPDIVVMDISMPGMGGLESTRRIIKRYPTAKIIIYTMHETASFASQALKSGVKGYVTKNGPGEALIQAVLEVANGKTFLSAEIAQKIALEALVGHIDPIEQLTGREFEVFRLLTAGKNVEEVAEMLKISQKTVSNYYTNIKQKLGLNSPIDMVRFALSRGLIEE